MRDFVAVCAGVCVCVGGGGGGRFSSTLCISCMSLPYGIINWGSFVTGCSLLQRLLTLMQFCFDLVLEMENLSRFVFGLLLHVFVFLLSLNKSIPLSATLFTLLYPKHHIPGEGANILPLIFIFAVYSSLWPFYYFCCVFCCDLLISGSNSKVYSTRLYGGVSHHVPILYQFCHCP